MSTNTPKTLSWIVISAMALAQIVLAGPAFGQGEDHQSLEEYLHEELMGTMAGAAESLEKGLEPASTRGLARSTPLGSTKMTSAFNCLPTCQETDGKFLAIAGSNLVTLSDPNLEFTFAVPAGTSSFQIGFFDGDGQEAPAHWDTGAQALFSYTLYADPLADGNGTTIVEMQSGSPLILSSAMPSNAWIDFMINTDSVAEAPSGNFFYRLRIESLNPTFTSLNAFKIRTDGVVSIELFEQPFSYIGSIGSFADLLTIFPNFPTDASCIPDAAHDCYDGSFDFYFDLPVELPELNVWGGDFDYGKFDGSELDTDDPDTPNAPFLPPWATGDAVYEGVAVGASGTTGQPADDGDISGFGIFVVKPPSVVYDVTFPDGQVFPNVNPSGNQEWEKFTISTAPFDISLMDFNTSNIPPGVYHMRVEGVDLSNLNALLLPSRLLCVDVLGNVCIPLRPFAIGDAVFLDIDGDGLQGPGEPGISGVVLNLLSPSGAILATTTTGVDGTYSFGVVAATFTVEIAPENFGAGGALEGMASTTGGDQITETVVDDNVLTFDFGYQGTGTIGDFIWFDGDGDGLQNEPSAGLAGVTVQLTGAGSDGVIGTSDDIMFPSRTTDIDGGYEFTGLGPGFYQVDVDETTLPAGLTLTTGNEPLELTLGPGDQYTGADFGYDGGSGSIGDLVWFDIDADGVQDAGEPGVDGVTVQLEGDVDGDGVAEIVLAVDTATVGPLSGTYTFTDLPAGSYRVTVDPSSLPAGLDVPTFDADGTGTPNTATVSLGDAESNAGVDFGYAGTGQIGDRVWNDLDGDGTQNDGATGINGVTVELLDAGGNVLATTTTSGDGNYVFGNLPAGTFTVRVDPSTLPAGAFATFDADGIGTLHTATITLGAGEVNAGVDFGYGTGTRIGDRVWLDENADGVQDPGENGINGVTVRLLDAGGIVATTTTSGDGDYLFEQVLPGVYNVSVDASTLPAGLAPTYDLDGLATPHDAMVTVAGDENRDVDFGYTVCGECSGKVTHLTLQYLGAADALVKVVAKHGPKTEEVFLGMVQPGGTFDLIGPPSGNHGFDGTLGTEIRIYVDGNLHTKIHTSCSVPIGPGLVSGDFALVFGTSRNNGVLCPLDGSKDDGGGGCTGDDDDDGGHHGGKSAGHGDDDDDDGGGACGGGDGHGGSGRGGDDDDDDGHGGGSHGGDVACGLCEGKVSELTLRYTGLVTAAHVTVVEKKGDTVFEGTVKPGKSFSFVGTDKKGTLGTEIRIYVNGFENTAIHTSCSQPIGPGLVSGDFEVLAGASREGGALCSLGSGP